LIGTPIRIVIFHPAHMLAFARWTAYVYITQMITLYFMKRLPLSLWALALLIGISSCSDPTLVGSDLLDDDQVQVSFSDTIAIVATTIAEDSIRTYTPDASNQLFSYLFGDMTDPVFGRSTSSLYLQALPEALNPDFSGIEIDSVVLVLPYDTNAFYGNTTATFGIEVFELSEVLDRTTEYYSDQTVMTEAVPLASATFQPKRDSVQVVDLNGGDRDTTFYPAQLRIPLDVEFGRTLTRLDSAVYASDSLFVEFFKGVHLKPTMTNEGMLAFDLRTSDQGGIHVYYRAADTIPLQFQYQFSDFGTRFANYQHDYTGTPVESALDDTAKGEEVLFIQGMAGTNASLTFPDLSDLSDNVIVNRAILEVTVADFDGDPEGLYDPSPAIILARPTDNGGLQVIADIEFITAREGLSIAEFFGGRLAEDEDANVQLYEMNMTAHFQEILDGTVPPELVLSCFPKQERAARSILFGTKHPEYSVKLKLALTRF
jgi:hypothetical protein